jgi:hypothetical protein
LIDGGFAATSNAYVISMGLPSGAASWLNVMVGFASGGSAGAFCRHADTDAAIATIRTTLAIIFMARAPIRGGTYYTVYTVAAAVMGDPEVWYLHYG